MEKYKHKKLTDLLIQSNQDTFFIPNINFSAATGKCLITGESYLEEAFEFYDNLMEWIKSYLDRNQFIELTFKLIYFNTSSSRGIVDILKLLRGFQNEGKEVIVNWFYEYPDDDDMLMEIEDFIDESEIKINLLPIKE